jgi:hypothetical protein
MGVIVEKDCIRRPDGRLICWDKGDGKLYLLTKELLDPDNVADEDLAKLLRMNARP